ncbi:MAG: heat-inducible transcriptional repressor HrcA [Clostridiales bacterium]|nr:heat-inducible transcriptional repressor HrcA [Clostridiales bacterium]
MDERKKKVLHAIIEDYIANAEPVGSRAVAKKYGLGVSPATIRNEMSDLEELGFIEQPHTSSGRVPSDKGYRYFVDHLMSREALNSQDINMVRQALAVQVSEMEDFMRSCCNLISRLTNYTTMISMPQRDQGTLQKLQLTAVNDYQLLVVLLSSSGLVRHKLINMPRPISAGLLQRIETLTAARLVGLPIGNLSYQFIRGVLMDSEQHQRQLDEAFAILKQILPPPGGHKVFTSGIFNMLAQPEFRDLDRLKDIFAMLEEDSRVKELLQSGGIEQSAGAVSVAIGAELDAADMQDCSLVAAHYYINGEEAGSIGVLGPRRMSYSKTMSLMEFIAKELSRTLSTER